MKQTAVILFFLLMVQPLYSQAVKPPTHVEVLKDGKVLVEGFEGESTGTLPSRWFNQKADARPSSYDEELRATYHYQVLEEDGNKYLRFEGIRGKHLNFPTKEVKQIDIYKTPILSWKWRVFNIPEGANEDDDRKNDAAASIYVVFDLGHVLFKKVPKSIRYTWSSSLPVGTELSKFFGNQKIVVVESGTDSTGKWIEFNRNIVEDYKRLFGDPPPQVPLAILILSDGNSTNREVKADYDDIMLLPVRKK